MSKQMLDSQVYITTEYAENDRKYVCQHLFEHNVQHTDGLLKNPGIAIQLYLKSLDGQVLGGILCDTFLRCLYIDVFWIDENYRGQGYGKAMIQEAERIAEEHGCIFAHTCTFSYQSPEFYQQMGYEVFGVIDDYPEGIKQYFLKKRF